MCKYLGYSCAVMLAVLMSVDAQAAPPKGGRGPTGPAIKRPVKQTAPIATPAKNNPNPTVKSFDAKPGAKNVVGTTRKPEFNPNLKPFTPAWYAHHPRSWWGTHPYRPAGLVTWGGLSRWVGLDTAPIVYIFGDDATEQTIINTEGVFDAKNPFETGQSPAGEQAAGMDADWYPLGMFSLIPPGCTEGIAMLQLALGKDGSIRGTYQDVLTDSVYPLTGSMDKDTQKAFWNLDDNKTVVYETGLQNLTESTTGVIVHFGDQKKQKWTLRRVEVEDSAPRIDIE